MAPTGAPVKGKRSGKEGPPLEDEGPGVPCTHVANSVKPEEHVSGLVYPNLVPDTRGTAI